MKQEIDLGPLFEDTNVSLDNQKQLTKNFLRISQELSNQKDREFGLYLLELLKEYPEIIPDKQELNFFFEDVERELSLNFVELEKELE